MFATYGESENFLTIPLDVADHKYIFKSIRVNQPQDTANKSESQMSTMTEILKQLDPETILIGNTGVEWSPDVLLETSWEEDADADYVLRPEGIYRMKDGFQDRLVFEIKGQE